MISPINIQFSQTVRPMATRMRGVTLVELLIAVALGLGVMSGILSLYVNVNETASYLNAASRVQENGRFAINHIGRTLRMAGYDDPAAKTTPPPAVVLEGRAGSGVTMTGFTIQSASDAVLVSYEGAPRVMNCQGVAVADTAWVTNVYAISANNELVCNTVTRDDVSTTTTSPQVIAEGIEGMQILYGVDSNADGVANRYYDASGIANWAASDVVSAKIVLLVNSVEEVYASTLHACESCSTFNPTPNRLMRGEFHSTVHFRNDLSTSP